MSETHDLEALTGGQGLRLQDLVDRTALKELALSFQRLAGVPIRIFSADGQILADAASEFPLCQYLNTLPGGRVACARTINLVKRLEPAGASESQGCFSGASYHVVHVEYEHRRLGRVVFGPYWSGPLTAPASLLAVDASLDPARAAQLMEAFKVVSSEQIEHLAGHIRATLDLILFSGHKALLTSNMHLAAVSENYRELQERNQQLQQAVDRLRELDRLKSNFLATVSHELRTPLTSIIGYSEMLTEGIAGELVGEQLEFVQTIREKGEQLLQLIKNLLDLSKLESGTMSVKRAPVHIDQVLRQVVSTLLPTARKKGVVLEAQAPTDLPEVHGDSEKLRQIFLNLTENAIKFTPVSGLIRLTASLVPHSDEEDEGVGFALMAITSDEIEVRVADTGIGIPPAERARVFDAFYQVDSNSTREYGGTGLGLSIVKRLVEAHEGTIRVEGNQPRGTVMVVTLPILQM
jgi:signal transduction histidine kinase